MNKSYQDKNWLYQQYWGEELSTKQIAKELNVDHKTILYWMIKFNILRRTKSEAAHLIQANHCELSNEAIEWIEGELLGDGSLQSQSKYSARFGYTSKYWEYINYVSNTLESFGIKRTGKIRKSWKGQTNKNGEWINRPITLFPKSFHYESLFYEELKPIRDKWYPDGKKIVPKDIKLTSLTCRQWLIGDGCLNHFRNGNPRIKLSTQGFLTEDVKWLTEQLNNLGFKSTRQPCRNTIHISTYSTPDFLNYIGKCPIQCYQYKWRL